jgi:hypothetical protein
MDLKETPRERSNRAWLEWDEGDLEKEFAPWPPKSGRLLAKEKKRPSILFYIGLFLVAGFAYCVGNLIACGALQ